MEVDNILKIIDKVSDRKLSYFSYEEDGKNPELVLYKKR